MARQLKCQTKGRGCPPFKHEGVFQPSNENVKRLLPDLNGCADCMAKEAPDLLSFRDDFLQIASITLVKKGPAFAPEHVSGASFGTFIRPHICANLMNAVRKERRHYARVTFEPATEDETLSVSIGNVPEPDNRSFVDDLIWDISVAAFETALPQLLNVLSLRERQVFEMLRQDMRNRDIAKALHISSGRVSQLVHQVEIKLKRACQRFGLIEKPL